MNRVPHPPLDDQPPGEAAIDLHSIGTFLRQWLRDPVKTASLMPSGRQLAHLMVAQLPDGCSRVVEIGAGTGAFTRELLDHGLAPAQVLAVEINPHLADFLRERYPGITVACGDARHLESLAREHGFAPPGEAPGAVVSGLGMLAMTGALRCEILRAAFSVLGEHGRFIQFTYGPASPVRRSEREALGLRMQRAGFAARNLPPATVYVYQRLHSHEIESVRQPPRR